MATKQRGGLTTYSVAVTTDSSGAATYYTDEAIHGFVVGVAYVKTDFANGSTFTITGETSGAGIWTESSVNASTVRYPIVAGNVASTGAASATVFNPPCLFGERVKIVIASGGATKTGTFYITVRNT